MRTIEVSEETYEMIKDKIGLEGSQDVTSFQEMIGKQFFFRAVTYHLVGRVTNQMGNFLKLEDASWVADSGRFHNAIAKGTLNEVEPVGTAFLNINSLCDFFPWVHSLPKEQK